MEQPDKDVEQILEEYEKQFANTGNATTVERAKGLMRNKLHATVNELCNLALHAEKEETRLKACQVVIERCMGKVTNETDDPAGDMFKALEAQSTERERRSKKPKSS